MAERSPGRMETYSAERRKLPFPLPEGSGRASLVHDMKNMNLPNKLTMLRILLIPVFVIVLYIPFPGNRIVALAVFVAASLTDMADGKIARKHGLVTDFGKFADPLADKILVFSAMIMFVSWGQMPAWVLVVVVAREFAVSGLRMIAASEGKVIAAAMSGKVKTATTMVCIILMMLPHLPGFLNVICWLAILVTTVYSGIEYFVRNKEVIDMSNI